MSCNQSYSNIEEINDFVLKIENNFTLKNDLDSNIL